MRVLVCGGRDYTDEKRVFAVLDDLLLPPPAGEEHLIIQGGARGADRLAAVWAGERLIECKTFSADWDNEGRAAGAIRNSRMLREGKPDLVIAFPGGRGTADMVKKAQAAGIETRIIP